MDCPWLLLAPGLGSVIFVSHWQEAQNGGNFWIYNLRKSQSSLVIKVSSYCLAGTDGGVVFGSGGGGLGGAVGGGG